MTFTRKVDQAVAHKPVATLKNSVNNWSEQPPQLCTIYYTYLESSNHNESLWKLTSESKYVISPINLPGVTRREQKKKKGFQLNVTLVGIHG